MRSLAIMLTIALVVAASCGHPARLEEPRAAAAPWCFSLEAERLGQIHYSRACTDSADLCSFARDRAIAFAEVARFTTVGACHKEAR